MKPRPPLDSAAHAFLAGGAADKEDIASAESSSIPRPPPKIQREQKVIRLPVTMIEDLRRVVFHHSALQNRRVTETEVVEIALQQFIDSQNI